MKKLDQLFTSLFKDFPALFWTQPTFKKIFVAPLLIVYHLFSRGEK